MQPVGYIGVNSVQKLRFTHKGSLFLYAAVVVLQVIFFGAQHSFAASEAYPLNVSHMLGTTVLPREPERIITLGWSGEDAVLAFGKKPVAMTRYGSFPSGIFPWNEVKLAGEQPVLLSGDLNFEAIAALRPDLILGVYSGIDQITYKRLSAIAPTIVYRSAPWGADWREQTEITGEALGQKAEAKQLITDTNIFLNKLGAQSPELKGKTFVFGTYFAGGNSVVVYLPKDPRVQALSELGLQPSVTVKALAHKNPEETSVSVSLEEIGTLDAEILIMWYGDGARAAAEAQPLFQRLEAVKRGSYVALDDPVSVWSTSALSVLSIPYGFPQFVPRLAEAARAAEIK